MNEIVYRNRRASQIENDQVRVTVFVEGGHIAEILCKRTDINPLWTPPWTSIEPSTWDRVKHKDYGDDAESRLLAGIGGQNLCLDIFGGPSAEEEAAGLGVHGEGSIVAYDLQSDGGRMTQRARFPLAHLDFERVLTLDGARVIITETVTNLLAVDRPVGWTQHVTLGPPFVTPGATLFTATATKSKVIESDFTNGKGYQETGAEFEWPMVPHKNGGTVDLRVYPDLLVSAGYTAHLMDQSKEVANFEAWHPQSKTWLRYEWQRSDFPWLGIWEENCARTQAPWNGKTITRGMEFGVSPMPESRRQMIERGSMFGVPSFRWLPAKSKVTVAYSAEVGVREEFSI